jgi:hypothetical protein
MGIPITDDPFFDRASSKDQLRLTGLFQASSQSCNSIDLTQLMNSMVTTIQLHELSNVPI